MENIKYNNITKYWCKFISISFIHKTWLFWSSFKILFIKTVLFTNRFPDKRIWASTTAATPQVIEDRLIREKLSVFQPTETVFQLPSRLRPSYINHNASSIQLHPGWLNVPLIYWPLSSLGCVTHRSSSLSCQQKANEPLFVHFWRSRHWTRMTQTPTDLSQIWALCRR